MKTIKIEVYTFEQLSEKSKETAIDYFRNINVDQGWWEAVYDDFKEIANLFGISVDLKRTYFDGFYHQGQGSSYTASVNAIKMIEGVKVQAWKKYSPNEKFKLQPLSIDRRVIELIHDGTIDVYATVTPGYRCASIAVSVYFRYGGTSCTNYDKIDKNLEGVEDWVTNVCEELNHFLFKKLRDEFDYLTSNEAVIETIIADDYDFTREGKRCHRL